MSSFDRQIRRASQRQELELVQSTVDALNAENTQLQMENKALFRAMGAMVAVSGGEIRIPRDMGGLLKNKNLVSDVDEETGEIVFRIIEVTKEQDATTEQ